MAKQKLSLSDILDDLSTRFIINVPQEELVSAERIVFQIELAYWFYCDFYKELYPELPNHSLKSFSLLLFSHCPLLINYLDEHDSIWSNFQSYKTRVPVCGTIILNGSMNKVLLVKGWASSSSWGFPKGKINKDEQDIDCAIRETWEEIGFDVTSFVNPKDFIEFFIGKHNMKQRIKLYIAYNVSEDQEFVTQTRKEISKIEWHTIASLAAGRTKKHYLVAPFMKKLNSWIKKKKSSLGLPQTQEVMFRPEEVDADKLEQALEQELETEAAMERQEDAPDASDLLRKMLGITSAPIDATQPIIPTIPDEDPTTKGQRLLGLLLDNKPATRPVTSNFASPSAPDFVPKAKTILLAQRQAPRDVNKEKQASLLALLKGDSQVSLPLDDLPKSPGLTLLSKPKPASKENLHVDTSPNNSPHASPRQVASLPQIIPTHSAPIQTPKTPPRSSSTTSELDEESLGTSLGTTGGSTPKWLPPRPHAPAPPFTPTTPVFGFFTGGSSPSKRSTSPVDNVPTKGVRSRSGSNILGTTVRQYGEKRSRDAKDDEDDVFKFKMDEIMGAF